MFRVRSPRGTPLIRSLGGFGGSVVINGAISVAVVPIVIATAGPQLWAGIAIAQAIASFAQVVVGYGWAVTGPATVAMLTPDTRGLYFRESLASRLWLGFAATPVLLLLVLLLAPGDAPANALGALAMLLPALGSAWFFVGERAPARLLVRETLPRAAGTAVGAALLLAADLPLVWFTACQAAGAALAVALGWASVLGRYDGRFRLRLRYDLRRLTGQTDGVVTAVTAALYVNLPVVLAGAMLPTQAPAYAVADKLQKLALTAISPVFQVTQGAVGGVAPEHWLERAAVIGRVSLAFGAVVAIGFSLLGGIVATVLTGGKVDPPTEVIVALGVALGAVSVSAIVGLSCLTALGAVRQVAISTVLGAVVGLPLIIAAGSLFGIVGIALATAASELVVTAYQLLVLRSRISASKSRSAAPPLLGSPTS